MAESDIVLGSAAVEVRADLDQLFAGFDKAQIATKKYEDAAKATGRAVQTVAADMERAALGTGKAATEAANAAKGAETASRGATAAAREQATATETANRAEAAGVGAANARADAIRRETAAMIAETAAMKASNDTRDRLVKAQDRITTAYDPLHRAQVRYRQDLDDITDLLAAGNISQAKSQEYVSAATLAYQRAASAHTNVERTTRSLINPTNLLSGLIGVQLVQSFAGAIERGLQYAGSLQSVAQQLGITTEQLQVYRFAGTQVGLTTAQVDQGISQLSKTLAEAATGSKSDAKVLQLVGFSLKEIQSGALTAGEAIPRIADFLKTIPNTAQRAAVELRLFGESGRKLDTLLAGGSAAINNLSKAAHDLGIVLSEDEIRNADKAANKIGQLKAVLEADIASIVTKNADSIVGLARAVATLTGALLNFLNSNPRLALGIMGGIAGLRFGPWGAVGGAVGGVVLGDAMADNAEDSSNDPRIRSNAIKRAQQNLAVARARRQSAGPAQVGRGAEFQQSAGGDVQAAEAELARQYQLGRRAIANMNTIAHAAGGKVNPDLQRALQGLNAPAGPKPKADHSAENAARNQREYESKLAQLRDQQLQYEAQYTNDSAERSKIQLELVEHERQRALEAIDEQGPGAPGKLAKFNQAQVDELKRATNAAFDARLSVEQRRDREVREREAQRVRDAIYERESENLKAQEDIAETASQRRAIERRLLELAKEHERQQIDAQLNVPGISPTERTILEGQRANLDTKYGGQQGALNQEARQDLRGVNATLGGEFDHQDQLDQIKREKEDELRIIEEAKQNELLTVQEAADRRVAIERMAHQKIADLETARNLVAVSAARSTADSLLEITGTLFGKQSKAYRTMFVLQKAFAIAEAAIQIPSAMLKALNTPFPANIAAIATVAALGASIVTNISQATAQFETGGWTGGVRGKAAGIVHGEEFVVKAGPAAANRGLLETINAGRDPSRAFAATAADRTRESGKVEVKLYNMAAGVEHEVRQGMTPGQVEIIARRIVKTESPEAVGNAMLDPDSRVSKTMLRTIDAPRRRF